MMPSGRIYRGLHHFRLFVTLNFSFQLNGFIYCSAMLETLFALYACSARRKQPRLPGWPAWIVITWKRANPCTSRANPFGVMRAGPVTGLARFHVIIPFGFVMFTLLGGLASLPSLHGYNCVLCLTSETLTQSGVIGSVLSLSITQVVSTLSVVTTWVNECLTLRVYLYLQLYPPQKYYYYYFQLYPVNTVVVEKFIMIIK